MRFNESGRVDPTGKYVVCRHWQKALDDGVQVALLCIRDVFEEPVDEAVIRLAVMDNARPGEILTLEHPVMMPVFNEIVERVNAKDVGSADTIGRLWRRYQWLSKHRSSACVTPLFDAMLKSQTFSDHIAHVNNLSKMLSKFK